MTLFLWACGSDPVDRLKAVRLGVDPSRPLEQVLGKCPYFSRVSWSSYPGHQGGVMARATGIYDLDALVGKQSGGRPFLPSDRAALAKAGVNLCYVMEYVFSKARPDGQRSQMAMMIVAMDWDQSAQLTDETVLSEIARGVAGEATIKAALDAADYCRLRPPSTPKRQ